MKRKAEDDNSQGSSKKRAISNDAIESKFRGGLFEEGVLDQYTRQYAESTPYKHGVIKSLISDNLLRNVRSEIQEHISFTPKETDIYRIYQSGDLANLDGLDDSSLKRLPSLLQLRDALYSEAFRTYLSQITKAGKLSGKKTDMAVNVYTPGSHLLCHDDVIGSRRVSYILYLTDPDRPWKEEWGGALRLYPTRTHEEQGKRPIKVPDPDSKVSIPPSFSQLSFFAVQPGESFHDVEEVYARTKDADEAGNDVRVRMAISGWYHIPQEGEDGYEPGLEAKLAEQSSLQQLQGKADQYDLPQPAVTTYEGWVQKEEYKVFDTVSTSFDQAIEADKSLSEEDLEFLLKYLAPSYLTPDTLDSVSEAFTDQCSLCLDNILSKKFAKRLQESITADESDSLPIATREIEDKTVWKVARPPHKHRYLFQQPSKVKVDDPSSQSPLYALLNDLLPSNPFRKWLQLATASIIRTHNLLGRRFRRGQDYTLATGYDEEKPRLEVTLAITPTLGWDDDGNGNDESQEPTTDESIQDKGPEAQKPGSENTVESSAKAQEPTNDKPAEDESPAVGGYLAYMAGDEDAANDEAGSDHGVEVPPDMSTGGRASAAMKAKKPKADPAVYQAAADDEDDGVLFSMPAGWNRMGLVLRDKGTMRFVKYVSQQAKGDRWDVFGEFEIEEEEDDNDDDDDEEEGDKENGVREGEGKVRGGNANPGVDGDESESTERLPDDDESSDESDD